MSDDTTTPTREFITVAQLAKWLGFSQETLNSWRCQGRGPGHLKIGRLIRYRVADVRAWLTDQTRGTSRTVAE